jgi:RNA polymerase primary sigma factor
MAQTKHRRRSAPTEIRPAESDRDILDQYFAEVSRFPLLTADGEKVLARRIRVGEHEAMEELVRRNLRFVVSVAKKYQNRGMPLIDLIGEGNVGLMTAARKFDPDQGVKFISYAVWWIRQAILAALARQGRTVRVPLNRTADLSRVIKAIAMLRDKLTREPTRSEIAHVTGISTEIVGALASLNASEVRLDATIGKDSDRALIERFSVEEGVSTEGQILDQFKTHEVERALLTLPARDAKILRLYFGLEQDREHTLDEIGKLLGVTRERVRQLRDRALKRLRHGAVGDVLRDLSAA